MQGLKNQLTPKQYEYIRNATHRWNVKEGAVRSGKSYVDIDTIIPMRIRQRSGKSGLNIILGVSKETIERNILQPMRERYTDALVGTINNRNIAQICGEPVYCLGAEKVSQVAKIQGSSIKYAYGDEVAKWNRQVFEMLQSRLDKSYSCFDGAFNPESPQHWLKAFLDRDDIDIYRQHYTLFDNPTLPPEFVDNICREYRGTVYYDRLVLGEWALAEGLIYSMYQDAIGELPKGQPTERCISLDYGTRNAFAALLWEKIGGVWWATREYYYSGRTEGKDKTDAEYGDDLDKWRADIPGRLIVIIDPSAASFIELLRRKSDKYKVLKADNAVSDGIRETATALHTGRIKVSAALKHWRDEASGYVWDDKASSDSPVKENDHLMDATRYFVKTKRVAAVRAGYVAFGG